MIGAAVVLAFSSFRATATVTMQLTDTSTFSGNPDNVWGITASGYDGGANFVAGENVGIYGMTLTPGGMTYGICLSPQGLVDYNPHTYDQLNLSAASALNSPAWASGGLVIAGDIMNSFLSQVIASGNRDEGWALTAAIYHALYANSTVTFANTTDGNLVESYYNTFSTTYSAINPIGYVLAPDPLSGQGTAGQEFLIPVPEPTTMIAGALLLLPFGASTVRIIRRRQVA